MKTVPLLALLAILASSVFAAQPPVPSASLVIKPVTQNPCLLIDPEDIPAVKRRFEALPDRPEPRKMEPALYGLLYGDEAFKKKTAADFMESVRQSFGTGFPVYRRYNETLYRYDVIASFGCLTDAEKKEFRDLMVKGAIHYTGGDPAQFPTGNDTCNRWTDQVMVAGLVGLSFPDEPLANAWVTYAVNQIKYQLDHGLWEGAWNEVPRYHNWTLLLYSGFFQALQRRTGVDFYAHPNTKLLLDWYLRFSSPLVRFPGVPAWPTEGEPTLPAWGDSNYGAHFQVLAMFAPHYASSDPAFAKRLMWMWRRGGSRMQGGWHFGLTFPQQADPTLPDAPQTLGTAFCRTPGYLLMRTGSAHPDEIGVYFRGGKRGLHPRADLGSFDLFAYGVPLVLGSQSASYGSPEHEGWHRSALSSNVVVFGGKSRERTDHGKVEAFGTNAAGDYVVANLSGKNPDGQPFQWHRHVLFVKPDYLVIWDNLSGPLPAQWFLHTTANRLEWEPQRVICHTPWQVDLDVQVLSPATKLVPNEQEGRFGDWNPKDPQRKKSDPYPFTLLKYFTVAAKPGQGFLTVLHPRKAEGKPISATLLEASPAKASLRVEMNGRVDQITLSASAGAQIQSGIQSMVKFPMQVSGDTEPRPDARP